MADTTLKVLFQLQDQMSGPISNITAALGSLQKLAVSVGAALGVAFGVRALVQLGKDAIAAAEQITSLSRQTGISLVNIQKLGAAADAVNMPMAQLSTTFRMLSEHAEMAAEGNKRQIELFNKLGISVRDMNGNIKTGEVLFSEFADVIAATKNPTQQMALAMELLGRSGTLALPILKLGAKGIKELGDNAEKAGMVMSSDVVQSLNTMGREFSALGTILTAQMGKMVASLVDVLPSVIGWIHKYAEEISGIVGAIGLLFTYVGNLFKFLLQADIAILGYLNDAFVNFKVNFVAGIRDLIDQVIDVFFNMGITIPQSLINASEALTKFVNKSKVDLPNIGQSYDEMYKTVADSLQKFADANDKTDEETQKSTAERTAALQSGSEAMLKYFDTLRKVGKETSNVTGQGARDITAMSQTISGGLTLAMEDIVNRTVDWRKAWVNMFDGIEKGITSALDTFILKGGKMKDLMKNIFDSIEQSFVHMLTSMLTQTLLQQFLGLFMGGGTQGGGGTMGNMVATMGGGSNFGANSSGSQGGGSMFGGGMFGGGGAGGGGGLLGGLMGTYLVGGNQMSTEELANAGMLDANGEIIGSGLSGGLTMGGALAGLGGMYAGYQMEQGAVSGQHVNVTHAVVGGAMSGMAAGAMIGSVIPGLGTVAGAVVGALAGATQGFISGKSAKKKQQKAEEEAAQAQAEQEAALRAQARELITADIRAKYGGGLADVSAVTDIGAILSGGISDATLDQMGGAAGINAQSGQIGQGVNNIQVSSPITVNATISGSYDTQVLAQDLGIQLAASIRSAASGAGI